MIGNGWLDHQTMLDRFRQWLEEARAEADGLSEEEGLTEPHEERRVGLVQLVEEFTALRQEVG